MAGTGFPSATAGRLAIACGLLACAGGWAGAGEAEFLSNPRQLIYEGRRSGEGYFSSDGKALVFQSEREPGNPFDQIYTLDFASGETRRISPGVGKTTCAFFRPHSQEVLFASTHHDPEAPAKQQAELEFRASGKERRYAWDYDEQFDLFVARRDGSAQRRLTTAHGYDAEASYSPDGGKIVFTSLRNAYPADRLSPEDRKRLETDPAYFGEIYLMDADGSNQRRLTRWPGYDGGPFFSPDGQRILFRHFEPNGVSADVYTMKLDGSDVRRLTDLGCMSWAPFFHPSGRYVIFTANKLGFANFELFLVDAAGQREPQRVTHTDGFDGLPVFSPDGRRLCWTAARTADGKSQLFLADWKHEAALAALKAAPSRGTTAPVTDATRPRAAKPAPLPPPKPAKLAREILVADLRAEVSYLASDALAGRMTGSAGARAAAEHIAAQLKRDGVAPLGEGGSYFQHFEFASGVRVVTNANRLALLRLDGTETEPFEVEKDFRPLSFSANGEVEGEVVFAGYGLFVPGKPPEGYDSYAGLDVTNKIVLVLRYVPEAVDARRRQELNRFAALRYKAMLARERGAKAILVVTGPNSPNAGELAPLSFDASMAGSGIVAATISGKPAEALLAGSGKALKALQTALDDENPHAEGGFVLPGVRLRLATGLEHLKKTDRNVLGVLPPGRKTLAPEFVLVGAHYDHLGLGETGALPRSGEENQVHNGADDNASGVAAVLELAAALATERKKQPELFARGVIFAFWSGEELGLIGSSHFVERPPVALSNLVANVNFDMVGRLSENQLSLQGVGSSSVWRRLIEKRNVAAGFNLRLQDDPYLPTDVTAFYPKGVPVVSFFTGSHDDYHRPTDDAERINFEGLERIARFAHGLVLDLVGSPTRPDYAKVESARGTGSRETLRAYLGTIPDYTTEVAGVKLSGVRTGSPADKAGLKGGDVIVEFAGQQIKNIYDYTYALDAVKIGQPVEITVLRDGARVRISATPEARK
jgi:Tol biopolymer transport system component